LGAVDFLSACMTAPVPREHLSLVVVRVIVTNAAGETAPAHCSSSGFLFDTRNTCQALVQASQRCAESCAGGRGPAIYTRVPEGESPFVPLSVGKDATGTVHENMTRPDGLLRCTVHVSGALRAWQRHCSKQSTLCVKHAAALLTEMEPEAGVPERHIYNGLQKLTGGGRPTKTVPAACVCSGNAACDCFMRRAMYRAGTVWLILYAVMPPSALAQGAVTGGKCPEAPAWVTRMLSGGAGSETESAGNEDPVNPAVAWPREMPPLLQGGDADDYAGGTASESLDSVSSESVTVTGDFGVHENVLSEAVLWARSVSRTHVKSWLVDASRRLGPYYGCPLRAVLAGASGPSWMRRLVRKARAIDCEPCEVMYRRMRRHDTLQGAVKSVVRSLSITALRESELSAAVACVTIAARRFHESAKAHKQGTAAIRSPASALWSTYGLFGGVFRETPQDDDTVRR